MSAGVNWKLQSAGVNWKLQGWDECRGELEIAGLG